MKKVTLELVEDFNYRLPQDLMWKLFIDGKPFPCESKSVMNHNEALDMIDLAINIEGTIDD